MSTKFFQVVLLAFAVIGFGFVPAGDALAGSCNSRPSHDRWHGSHNNHRVSHDRWHGRSHGTSYHYRNSSHYGHSSSRAKVSYRNDNVRFSVSVGSGRHYDYHQPSYHKGSSCSKTVVYQQPRYRSTSCSKTVVVHNPAPSGYWKRVYHAPVYETRYASCGTPYRVTVRAGYYERVWVSTSHRY
ncbi:MAG: hypothetical protein AAF085_05255 [Planctomycetota bacterium]